MPRLTHTTPKYRKHRSSGQAVVNIAGRDYYLGPHGSRTSKAEYDRIIGEWLANGRRLQSAATETTIAELLAAYWRFAKSHYGRGKNNGELDCLKSTLRLLRHTYGHTLAADFGPLALHAVRQKMVDTGQSRPYVNHNVQRIRRVFRWGVAREMLPAEISQRLASLDGLRKGKTKAHETPPVLPVGDSAIEATLPHLPVVVGNMVRFQLYTGARPGEVCDLRPCDVDTTGSVWSYRPESHKTEHHGRERVIFIGPKAQDILRRYLLRPSDSFCFSPKDSERKRRAEVHAIRKTPLSCGNRPGSNRKQNPKRTAGEMYTTKSYRGALHRACIKAGVEKWSPNQLRHSAATDIRRRFGLEAAQVTLGHSKADTTQIYAERDFDLARRVAAEVG